MMVSSLLGVTPLLRPNEELNDIWSNRDPLVAIFLFIKIHIHWNSTR